MSVFKEILAEEQAVLDSVVRRPRFYAEVAPDMPQVSAHTSTPASWEGKRHAQEWPGTSPGGEGIGEVSVCRMADMRVVVAISSGDGGGPLPYIVSTRLQSSGEAFGSPRIAYYSSVPIRDISLLSGADPLLDTWPNKRDERTLFLLVNSGTAPDFIVRLLASHDLGVTWDTVWEDLSGELLEPRLRRIGYTVGLFYRSASDNSLMVLTSSIAPRDWTLAFFAWDGAAYNYSFPGGLPASGVWDVELDTRHIYLGTASGDGTDVTTGAYYKVPGFGGGYWVGASDTVASTLGPQWLRINLTAGDDLYGSYPADRIVLLWGEATKILYSLYDMDSLASTLTPAYEQGKELLATKAIWLAESNGFHWRWDQTGAVVPAANNAITNHEMWLNEITPSTSIIYDTDAEGDFVSIDNHGPDVSDDDAADTFAGFWTKSNQLYSGAFPPFDAATGLEVYFKIQFYKPSYHNIWFVVDDPASDWPIFKADFYVGSDTDPVGTHPHDNARGLAMWFGKEGITRHQQSTPDNSPRGTVREEYRHPIKQIFQGFDDNADNLRVWKMLLKYVPADDTFELHWAPAGDDTYVPFVPYLGHSLGDREYVDVGGLGIGGVDEYVASGTETYWKQPRNGRWPRRFYIGCPEQKPAFEKQSGIKVYDLDVVPIPVGGAYTLATGLNKPHLLRRLNGALDFYYVVGDVLWRQPHGYGWSDLYTVTDFHSSWSLNSGPDQAECTILNVDNFRHNKIYDNLASHHLNAWGKSGGEAYDPLMTESGMWGRWVPLFSGTSDTGKPTDTDAGSFITMNCFSPLRNATRSHVTRTFSSLEPPPIITPAVPPDPPVDTGVPDVKAIREWQIIYMKDFDRPNDNALPVDSQGRLMRFEDYLLTYAWTDILGNPPSKLVIERVGYTPTNFTLGGGEDILESLRPLWAELGMVWYYDFWNGGVYRVHTRGGLTLEGDPDLRMNFNTSVALPFSRSEDDWKRPGNLVTTASNVEQRPNNAVARVAPWPDGSGRTDQGIDNIGGLPSQFATAEMYKFKMPFNLLRDAWEGSAVVPITVPAFPYFWPGQRVELALGSLPDSLAERFASVAKNYFVWKVEHKVSPTEFTTNIELHSLTEYPL